MTDSGERTFKIAATLETIERGQDLSGFPHMTILRWLHEDMPWGEFETRLQALFSRPNPFTHPDTPQGTRVARQSLDTDTTFTELNGVSKWPHLGVGALVSTLKGSLVNETFAPRVVGVEPSELGVGSRVRFTSVAVAEYGDDDSAQEVRFVQPIINAPESKG